MNRRTLLLLVLSIGLLQMAGHYLAGALVRSDGGMAIPQTDTLLYCQAARRIVEGCPLSFSVGTAASTGTTSHMYPFVLAVPYLIGFRGDSLIRAGFLLNGIFYLVFLLSWGFVIDRRLSHPFSRLVAAIMVTCLGQTAYSAFAQSDIGMWLAISGVLAAGFASENRLVYGLVLVAAPWVRPEGMVCAIAFAMVAVALLIIRIRLRSGETLAIRQSRIALSGCCHPTGAKNGACRKGEVRLLLSLLRSQCLGIVLLVRTIPRQSVRMAAAASVFLSPVCICTLLRGNPSGWSFALVCVFLFGYRSDDAAKRFLAAVSLGAATSLKVAPCLWGCLYLAESVSR